eukprot:15039054-Heterocapsa_arctica.AAC.1
MAGSIAGKHLMVYVRAAKANQSDSIPLVIMAVPDYHLYEDVLANDPFQMNPGISVGHDKVEVSKAQQVINSSAKGIQVCIIILGPSADTLQTWYFAPRNIGWQQGICLHIMFATHDSCAYESMDILAYVMTNWPGTVIKHLNHIETLIQGLRGTAGLNDSCTKTDNPPLAIHQHIIVPGILQRELTSNKEPNEVRITQPANDDTSQVWTISRA